MDRDWYSVLGVETTADSNAVKAAFRRKVMECHPDRGGSHEQMVQVNEAWAVLSNPEQRQRYDAARCPTSTAVVLRTETPNAARARKQAEQYPPQWADYERWLDSNEDVWLRSFDQNCPACGSEKSKRYMPRGYGTRWDTVSIVAPRKCIDCGAVYLPPAPAWAIGVTGVVGVVFLAFVCLVAFGLLSGGIKPPDDSNLIQLLMPGFLFVVMPGVGGVSMLVMAHRAWKQRQQAAARGARHS